jgi:hypothetical protein
VGLITHGHLTNPKRHYTICSVTIFVFYAVQLNDFNKSLFGRFFFFPQQTRKRRQVILPSCSFQQFAQPPCSYYRQQLVTSTVVGTNLCVSYVRNIRQGGHGGWDGKQIRKHIYCPYYKHYFPVAVLCSSLSQLLCRWRLWSTQDMRLFSFYLPVSDVREMHSLVPAILQRRVDHQQHTSYHVSWKSDLCQEGESHTV